MEKYQQNSRRRLIRSIIEQYLESNWIVLEAQAVLKLKKENTEFRFKWRDIIGQIYFIVLKPEGNHLTRSKKHNDKLSI